MKLENKVGLMTASGSGIGRAISRLFAREGAKVVVNDINPEGGQKTVKMIKEEGEETLSFEAMFLMLAKLRTWRGRNDRWEIHPQF